MFKDLWVERDMLSGLIKKTCILVMHLSIACSTTHLRYRVGDSRGLDIVKLTNSPLPGALPRSKSPSSPTTTAEGISRD